VARCTPGAAPGTVAKARVACIGVLHQDVLVLFS
jgi:hypothetical protein